MRPAKFAQFDLFGHFDFRGYAYNSYEAISFQVRVGIDGFD